jgi:hypothetical protein
LVGLVSIFVSSFFPCGLTPGAHLSLGFFFDLVRCRIHQFIPAPFASCSPVGDCRRQRLCFPSCCIRFPSFTLFAVSRRSPPARSSGSVSCSPAARPSVRVLPSRWSSLFAGAQVLVSPTRLASSTATRVPEFFCPAVPWLDCYFERLHVLILLSDLCCCLPWCEEQAGLQ